jgi:hypothetical protein
MLKALSYSTQRYVMHQVLASASHIGKTPPTNAVDNERARNFSSSAMPAVWYSSDAKNAYRSSSFATSITPKPRAPARSSFSLSGGVSVPNLLGEKWH